MTYIVVVANAKGGAGKTTTSLGLAAEAAHRGRKTLLIDADVQANATEHLIGLSDPLKPQGDGGKALHRLILDGDPLRTVPAKPGLDLVPAGPRTQGLSDELARMFLAGADAQAAALTQVRATVQAAVGTWDFIVIDTPPSEQSGALIDCFLAAADELLIPLRPSPEHSFAAFRLLNRLVNLTDKGVTVARPAGLLLFDLPTNAHRIAGAAAESLGALTAHVPLFNTIIGHRQGPAAAAARLHLTPRELAVAATRSSTGRLKALRTHQLPPSDALGVSSDVSERFAGDFAALYDELITRHEAAA